MLTSPTRALDFVIAPLPTQQTLRVVPHTSSSQAMELAVIDPRADSAWDEQLRSHPDATIFQSSAWANVLSETYGHTPKYLRCITNGALVALVPLMEVRSRITGTRGVSVPFSDFCAPLFFSENANVLPLIEHMRVLGKERDWKYFEVRGALPAEIGAPVFEKFYGHELELTKSPEEIFAGFESAMRRGVRKAEQSGLEVQVATDGAAMRDFYQLHARTRRRHGIPPQPFAFFANIQRHIIERGLGFLVLARKGQRAVAGAVFFHFGERALFKFGASDERFQAQRPNNLVMWLGIQECTRAGLKRLHFGRTDFEHAGLRRFKQSMGAREEVLHYHRFEMKTGRWMNERAPKSSLFSGALFGSLPLTINRLAGTVLYPHLH